MAHRSTTLNSGAGIALPLILIGHPYGIQADARRTLDAIRSLGLVVCDYHPSWYGFGTVQIRVYHPATLNALTRGGR